MSRVLIGMSGGVDSSLAAALLIDAGHTVTGATISLFDTKEPLFGGRENTDLIDAQRVCEALKIPHQTLDLSEDFRREVIDNFISEYFCGNTPSPCIVCNKKIKFGKMLDRALQLGQEKIATGHYARIEKIGDRFNLLRAADRQKDQSYMLYSLSQSQLEKSIFPLGALTKAQVRESADEKGLVTSRKKDSQDICFVPSGDYATLIETLCGKKSPCGEFCDENGQVLGEHKGIIRYTEGQRKGLGIAVGRPIFVLSKDTRLNRVILGDEPQLYKNKVYIKDTNFIPFDTLTAPIKVTAKLRYRHEAQNAVLHPWEGGAMLEFSEPQRAPTAGQAAVCYDGDTVIGGGTII